jgi:hypothetical protein
MSKRRKNKNHRPKKYTSQTLTGQKGINLIERVVLEMGFVWTPTNLDAGIDGIIEIRDTTSGEASNFIIQVQSKATEQDLFGNNGNSFDYVCDERDLDYWLKGNCPVILVRSNVAKNEAYWISIKDYFSDQQRRKTRKIVFEKSKHSFSQEARDTVATLAIPEESGFYLSPPPISEQIYSNLLPLVEFPEKIFEAKTKYRKNKEFWDALNQLEVKKGINRSWVLHEGKIYSFNDLNKSPWINFISITKDEPVKTFPSTNWCESTDLDLKRLFVRLLNGSLETYAHHKGILHKKNEKIDLFYFRPTFDSSGLPATRRLEYNRLGRKSHQNICNRYSRKSDPSIISYYRHLSFEGQFVRFGMGWFLEITPTYFFTHDGFKLHTYYESKLKGKKGLDKAEIVFSETLFWADVLTRGRKGLFDSEILAFGTLYNSEFSVGINDEVWLEKEDDEKKQILTNQLSLFKDES